MEMNDAEKLKGTGGWLGLYILLGFLDLISVPVICLFPTVETVSRAVLIICNAIACFLLIKKNSNAVKWTRLFLWSQMGVDAAFFLFHAPDFLWTWSSGRNYYEAFFAIRGTLGGIFSAWIWLSYFEKSERVKLNFPDSLLPAPSNQSVRLWNWVGVIVILIYLPLTVYGQVLKAQIKPIIRESIKKGGTSVGSLLRNPLALQKEALRKLWESKH